MARFLLIHGAWHGGWSFDKLAEQLRSRGHDVDAPDLPCDDVALDQHDYARLLGPRPDTVVVGHSLGAQTAALVEARRHVYLAGLLPVEDAFGETFAPGWGGFVRDELGRSYWPDLETTASRLYHDCERADAAAAFPRLRPQAAFGRVVVPIEGDVVLATRRDVAIDGAWQARAGRALGAHVIELDRGHFPMVSHPDELAAVLDQVSREPT